MASPSIAKNDSSVEPSKTHEVIVDALERGEDVAAIAKRLAKGDKAKAKRLRAKIWRIVRKDAQMQRAIAERGQLNMLLSVPSATRAAGKRASKGRMDAVRSVLEVSGVHNPRVKHEHSGDITVKLEMPRPRFDADADVVGIEDADPVEDD